MLHRCNCKLDAGVLKDWRSSDPLVDRITQKRCKLMTDYLMRDCTIVLCADRTLTGCPLSFQLLVWSFLTTDTEDKPLFIKKREREREREPGRTCCTLNTVHIKSSSAVFTVCFLWQGVKAGPEFTCQVLWIFIYSGNLMKTWMRWLCFVNTPLLLGLYSKRWETLLWSFACYQGVKLFLQSRESITRTLRALLS